MFIFIFLFLFNFYSITANFVSCSVNGQMGNHFFQIANMLAFAWDHNLIPVMPDMNKALGGQFSSIYFHKLFSQYGRPSEGINWVVYQEMGNPRSNYRGYNININENDNIFLQGYFENYKYFDKYRDRFVDLFQLPRQVQAKIEEKYKKIFEHKNSVAVHIRTGNYPIFMSFPGLDFYFEKMSSFDKDTLFVVCSDRPDWVKENLKNWNFDIIYPDDDCVSEFHLMRNCKHIICSIQSTFAFWAAYLNTNPDKKVLAQYDFIEFTEWYPSEWNVELCPAAQASNYPDMGLYRNKSLDNR